MKLEHGSLLLLTEEFKADNLLHNWHIELFKLSHCSVLHHFCSQIAVEEMFSLLKLTAKLSLKYLQTRCGPSKPVCVLEL